jgi:homoserine kinase type II
VSRRRGPGDDPLRDVLARFGIADGAMHDIRSGRVNRHWRIVSPDTTYALRRYTPRRSPAAIAYEHDILARLACRGWPVAAPIAARHGATFVELHGSRYSLFPFLPGRPSPYGNARYLRLKGGLLARLHQDLAGDPPREQRDGFGRLWELDPVVRDGRFSRFDDLLQAFGREHPTLGQAVHTERQRSLQECARTDWSALPNTVVHCDFHHDNILFSRGRLTAILDFDIVRTDARIVDIACSLALDCLRPPDYDTVDPNAARALVAGYAAEAPLTATERALVVPLIRASFLWLVAFRLTEWAAGAPNRAEKSIARRVHRRFPGLDRDAPAIALAIEHASQAPE